VNLNASHFGTNVNLRSLQIDACAIQDIANHTFKRLGHLRELFLDLTQIRSVTVETFTGIMELNQLSLKNNKITFLPRGAFRNLKKLTVC
jgi:Leucine-rich repeat (LRR) protein